MIQNFYIATDGNDRNNGKIDTPFKTLHRALQKAEELSNTAGTVRFFVRGGEYRLRRPLLFNNRLLKNPDFKIVFQNHENEKVVISGSEILDTVWKNYNENIKVADIGTGLNFDVLFADNQPQVLCRYPNYKEDEILNGCSADAISKERTAKWENPEGGYIRALHNSDWGGNSYIIKGKTQDNGLIREWIGDNNRGSAFNTSKVMAENIFEELDSENEWYYHKNTGELFYYPPKGVDIQNTVFEAAATDELFIFKGRSAQTPIGNVTVQGFEFTKTNRTMFTKKYERPLRGDWAIQRTGAVYLENAENITVKSCKFYRLGGNAVMMSGYNKGHFIDDNDFTDIGATGVLIAGLQEAARDPSTWDNENHKTVISDVETGPKTEDYPRKISVSGNYFFRNGVFEKQSAGVCISISEFITVSKNTVHHMPRAGINISDGCFGGHIIEGNDIFDCVRETGDHGPFNSWGRDRFWSLGGFDTTGSKGAEKRPFACLDARSTSMIRNNRIHANHAFGIDLDDGSSNYEIYNNLCLGAGIKTREGFDRKVYNNILIGCAFEVHVSYAMNRDIFFQNIIYHSKAYNFISLNEGNTTVYKDNIYWNNGEAIDGISDTDTVHLTADPMFIDPGTNNYALNKNSAALKKGFTNFPMSNHDFGRSDKPKPPVFMYVPTVNQTKHYEFADAGLSDVK